MIDVKTNLIQATQVTILPGAVANQYVELLGDAELMEIAGGHNLESDAAESLAEAVVG